MTSHYSEGVKTLLAMIEGGKITVAEIEEVLKMQSRTYINWTPALQEALTLFKSKSSITQAEIDSINKKITPNADAKSIARRRGQTINYIKRQEGIDLLKKSKTYYSVVAEDVATSKLQEYLANKKKFNFKNYAEANNLTQRWVIDSAVKIGWSQSTGFNMIRNGV